MIQYGPDTLRRASDTLLREIAAAARAGASSPSYADLTGALRAAGLPGAENLAAAALTRLERDGGLRRTGSRTRRVYILPDGAATVPVLRKSDGAASGGWPRVTAASAASYDAAVAARAFARHEVPPRDRCWAPVSLRGLPSRSLTGCAAALMEGGADA